MGNRRRAVQRIKLCLGEKELFFFGTLFFDGKRKVCKMNLSVLSHLKWTKKKRKEKSQSHKTIYDNTNIYNKNTFFSSVLIPAACNDTEIFPPQLPLHFFSYKKKV